VAVFSIGSGCMSGETTDRSVGVSEDTTDESIGEATEAVTRPGIYLCTRSGGEEWTMSVPASGDCKRTFGRSPVASDRYCTDGVCPGCKDLARSLQCVTVDGKPL
jgi:hypothetical protein